VLPFRDAKDEDDEKHVHPLQLDVIERYLDLRTSPGERVLTPFMGVGSEVYVAVTMDRVGIGVSSSSRPTSSRRCATSEVAIARAVAGTRVALTRDEMREAVRRLDAAGRPATHLGISGGTLRRLRAENTPSPAGDGDTTTTARRSA
jgi:hypothetical protein